MQVRLEVSHVMRATRVTAVTAPGERGIQSTCGLVAMTSAQHAEGRQFDPGQISFKDVAETVGRGSKVWI